VQSQRPAAALDIRRATQYTVVTMVETAIRPATEYDLAVIVDFIRLMAEEMAGNGGYPVDRSPDAWSEFTEQLGAHIGRYGCGCFLAEQVEPEPRPVGAAVGYIVPLEQIFVARKRLHISAVYVIPEARGQGLGRGLIETCLNWGRNQGALEAELNVLVDNPARHLYEELGFRPHGINMVRPLN
jgi:ribosomal protein S18 acetylase RimI-like enzyme